MGKGVTRRDSAHVAPQVKLCMCTMYYVCCSKGLSDQSTIFGPFFFFFFFFFLAFFCPDIRNWCCLIHILKHSPDYIDSKYIWV